MNISVPKSSPIKAFMPYCLFQKKDSSISFGFQVAKSLGQDLHFFLVSNASPNFSKLISAHIILAADC